MFPSVLFTAKNSLGLVFPETVEVVGIRQQDARSELGRMQGVIEIQAKRKLNAAHEVYDALPKRQKLVRHAKKIVSQNAGWLSVNIPHRIARSQQSREIEKRELANRERHARCVARSKARDVESKISMDGKETIQTLRYKCLQRKELQSHHP